MHWISHRGAHIAVCARRVVHSVLVLALLGSTAQSRESGSDRAVSRNLTLLGIESGTVAPAGLGFASLSYSSETDDRAGEDTVTIGGGLGFGDAATGIGVQISGYATADAGDGGSAGSFALKASTRIAGGPAPTYAAVMAGNLFRWGDDFDDLHATFAITHLRHLAVAPGAYFPLALTVGYGSDIEMSGNAPGAFIGAGMGLTEQIGASVAWAGDAATLGISYRPGTRSDLTVNAAVSDAFNAIDRRRFTLSVNVFTRAVFGR